jgi:HlyD family secretion protein
MRGSTIVLLIIALVVLVGVTFVITNPESAQQLLVDLGLATPPADAYIASGVIEVPTVALSSEIGGRVDELLVVEGDAVQQGDVVARLSTDLLEAQRAILLAASDETQAQLGMLKAGARDEDIAVAEAAVALAQSVLDGANQALLDAQSISSQVPTRDELIDLAQAQVDQAQARLDSAEAGLHALEQGATDSLVRSAQAAVDAARAQVDEIERQISNQDIQSPIDGVVMERLALVGELALPGWPIILVADLSEVELKVYIPEADLSWVYLGQNVALRVDAYPERAFHGTVVVIAEEAEFTPRNVQTPNERVILVYEVIVRAPNTDGALKPGLPADAVFEVGP